MKYNVEAVLFDLDGVIVFSDKYHYLGWKRLADEEGWKFDEKVNHKLRGVSRIESLEIILEHNKINLPQKKKEELANKKNEYYVDFLKNINKKDVYPGSIEFIKKIRDRGVKVGLCSSSKNADLCLEKLNITDLFDTVVSGNDITKTKPDPQIFLLAAERLNVHPMHCVVFEDAETGIDGAIAAKMKTVGVGSKSLLPKAGVNIEKYESIDVDCLLETGFPKRLKAEAWKVTEEEVDERRQGYWESIFALTNGYMGVRGTYEEENPVIDKKAYPGMFINGIYSYRKYEHVEKFPGFPENYHGLINIADWRVINLSIDGEKFDIFNGKVEKYNRTLNMKEGVLTKELLWTSPKGKTLKIKTSRIVSMSRVHSAVISYEVTPQNFAGLITFESVVNVDIKKSTHFTSRQTKTRTHSAKNDVITFECKVPSSSFVLGMAFKHKIIDGKQIPTVKYSSNKNSAVAKITVSAKKKHTVCLEKYASFYTSRETDKKTVLAKAVEEVESCYNDGFKRIYAEQKLFWKTYWKKADIEIEGNVSDQQAIRFNLFHLRQSHTEENLRSISATGLQGDGYSGHIFWDTEMYMAPVYTYSEPSLVRPLLQYRYSVLERARERASQLGHKGALFSWNTISGEEVGTVYEAATAEYHINAAVAYAIKRDAISTGDNSFLYNEGAEIIFECARFYADLGEFIPNKNGAFCLNIVCGPDEYGCAVNNNCYTNMMAQFHFNYALEVYNRMKEEMPEKLSEITNKISLNEDELAYWKKAADLMYIPYNEKMGIHEQDDRYLSLAPVDMNTIVKNHDIRHDYHPLNLWRLQVSKQADVVLLMFVMGNQFSKDIKKRNYDFYEARTNHGSSLSPCIHSIVASEIDLDDSAYEYFYHSAYMDLSDFKRNVKGGIHSACLGGTWMSVVNGFAGMRDYDNELIFSPKLPKAWNSYRFKFLYRKRLLEISIEKEKTTYSLLEGEKLSFFSSGKKIDLKPGESVSVN